jgi:hypothetical protein
VPGCVDPVLIVWYDPNFAQPRKRHTCQAPSPSGKAEVCKTSTPGSNPGGASKSNVKHYYHLA